MALLFGFPQQSFFLREIARQTNTSAGSVQRELEILSNLGLIERTNRGRLAFYQANAKHPAFQEIRSLIDKTAGTFHVLRNALTPLAGRIALAFVYGSIARGDETAGSDIDLMVVGDLNFDELLTHLAPAERSLGRPVNPTVYSLKEFKSRIRKGNHFLTSVVRGAKRFLIGDEGELREKWAEYGWLRPEPSSREEIRDLLGIVARGIKDAKVEAISEDLRFQAAFSAALTSANIALRASGYRTRMQPGHHQKVVDSLELTLKADPNLIRKLSVLSRKRNATSYDAAGNVSMQELAEAVKTAEDLYRRVMAWLKESYPELLK